MKQPSCFETDNLSNTFQTVNNRSAFKNRLLIALVLWFTVFGLSAFQTVSAQSRFDECAGLTETNLRSDLNVLSQDLFALELNNIDLYKTVNEQWALQNLDAIIAQEVALGIETAKVDTNYLDRLWSSWSPDKAQELATTVSTYAFGSEGFLNAIETLSIGVAGSISQDFETVSQRAATDTILCVQDFIGDSYGTAVVSAFQSEIISQTAELELQAVTDNVDATSLPLGTILGVTTILASIIARRLITRLAQKLSQRIAGRIASRVAGRAASTIVPVVGWVLGLGLIAYDLVDGNNGAFPVIQTALTSVEVSEEIKTEIVISIQEELASIGTEAAREVADSVHGQWRDFEFKFQKVLALAETSPEFNGFLGRLSPEKFQQLSGLHSTLGDDGTLASLANNSLLELVQLPPSSLQMLSDTGSTETVLNWSAIAGANFDKVAASELYKHKQASDFSAEGLDRLLLTNTQSIAKLSMLDKIAMDTIVTQVSVANLNSLAEQHEVSTLKVLADYYPNLDLDARNALVNVWTQRPDLTEKYLATQSMNGIIGANNQAAAINFIASDTSLLSLYRDIPALISGDIPFNLFLAKYQFRNILIYAIISIAALFLVLAILSRLIFGRRRKVIIKEVIREVPAQEKSDTTKEL